jgi:hypothetical protein
MNDLLYTEKGVTIMKCNPNDYRDDFASFNLTEEQEDELILTLWEMARAFVEAAYGVHPINNIFTSVANKTGQELEELPK